MSELKLNNSPTKFESPSEGRFVEPKVFIGFQNQGLRLMVARPPSFPSKLSRISSRQYEHFLPDHFDTRVRPKFNLFGEQFFNSNTEIKDTPTLNSSRNNDSKSSQVTRSVNASPLLGPDFVLEPTVRSQVESRSTPRKLPAGASVLHPIPLEVLTKARRSDGSSRSRPRPKKSHSFNSPSPSKKSESVQNIFRASTIHIDGSELPWK